MGSAPNCDGTSNEKIGIRFTSEGVHIAAGTSQKNICKTKMTLPIAVSTSIYPVSLFITDTDKSNGSREWRRGKKHEIFCIT